MSIVSVNHLCRDVMRDVALRKRLQDDPEGELAKYPRQFTPEERKALLSGDVGTLYKMGANTFVLGYLGRYQVFGLNSRNYSERMHAMLEPQQG
jgi:hypothetical protein